MFDRRSIISQLRDQRETLLDDPDDYAVVVGFLAGCDAATFGGFLAGFLELVELKHGSTSDVHWSKLAIAIRWPEGADEVEDSAKIEWLPDLLGELFWVDSGPAGIRRIHYEWGLMARREASHDVDLIRFGASPAPECISVDEAGALIGFLRNEMFVMASEGYVRSGRIGGEVMFERAAIEALTRPPINTHTYRYGPVEDVEESDGKNLADTPVGESTPEDTVRFVAAMLGVLDAALPKDGCDEAALTDLRRAAAKILDPNWSL